MHYNIYAKSHSRIITSPWPYSKERFHTSCGQNPCSLWDYQTKATIESVEMLLQEMTLLWQCGESVIFTILPLVFDNMLGNFLANAAWHQCLYVYNCL